MNALARRAAGLLFSTVCLPLSALAADPQPTHEFTLDNGLKVVVREDHRAPVVVCLLYTSPSPRDQRGSRMPSSA